jgi:Cu+-exporting ATPase
VATVVEKRSDLVDEWVTIHETARLNLPLRGMTCSLCIATLKRGLAHVPGIYKASVNLATEQSTLTHDREQVGVEEIARAIQELGSDVPHMARTSLTPLGN